MTVWTEHLARKGAIIDGSTLRFASLADEAQLVGRASIAVPLLQLGTIRIEGADAATFLHNLVSNEVSGLGADALAWNSFNSPKGRMLASFLLWRDNDVLMLAAATDLLAAFAKRLSMYVLRSKAKVTDSSADTVLIGVAGADAAAVLNGAGIAVPGADMRHGVSGDARCLRINADTFVLAVAADAAAARFDAVLAAGAQAAGSAAWQLHMIRAGLPMIAAATQDEFVAQMLNFELIGGVSFSKGCYPGQEIVARTQYLGKLKKRMYRLALPADSAASAGADLYAAEFGEQSAGKLVNVAPAPEGGYEALAVLQTSTIDGEIRIGAADGKLARVLDLPYALP